MIYICKKTEL